MAVPFCTGCWHAFNTLTALGRGMQVILGLFFIFFVTCLCQSESVCAQTLHSLPLIAAPAAATGTVAVHSEFLRMTDYSCRYVCMSCADRVANGQTTYFSSHRSAQVHVGRSVICRREGKGIRRIVLQHKSTDQKPGGSGTAGPWPPARVSIQRLQGSVLISYTYDKKRISSYHTHFVIA